MAKQTNTKKADRNNNNDNNNKCAKTDGGCHPAGALGTMLDAWERTRARREAIPVNAARPLSLDVTNAVVVMRGAYERLLPMRERIVGEFASFDAHNFDDLPLYWMAALHGNARTQAATEAGPAVLIAEVVAGADRQYSKMMRAYVSVADAGLVSAEALEKIREGSGWRNRAESLHALVALGLARWDEVKKVSILRDEDLALATSLADQILGYFARKSQSKVASEAQIDRRRALILAVDAYEEVRRAVQWMRWHEGDADELAPSVFAAPFKRSAKRVEAGDQGEGEGEHDGEEGGVENEERQGEGHDAKAAKPAA